MLWSRTGFEVSESIAGEWWRVKVQEEEWWEDILAYKGRRHALFSIPVRNLFVHKFALAHTSQGISMQSMNECSVTQKELISPSCGAQREAILAIRRVHWWSILLIYLSNDELGGLILNCEENRRSCSLNVLLVCYRGSCRTAPPPGGRIFWLGWDFFFGGGALPKYRDEDYPFVGVGEGRVKWPLHRRKWK